MSRRNITRQRLEYLLKNWGTWERSLARTGPGSRTVCGSAESRYASDSARYVWEGTVNVPRETPDDMVLAELTEEALTTITVGDQQMLVARYAREYSVKLIAARMGMSVATAEARIDSAMLSVWRKLEETSWASGL